MEEQNDKNENLILNNKVEDNKNNKEDLIENNHTEKLDNNEEEKRKKFSNFKLKTQVDLIHSKTRKRTIFSRKRVQPIVIPSEIIFDRERCHNLNQRMIKKVKDNASIKLDTFFTKKRNFLIMTDGGKPVYSRYGDAIENNSIFATISAMITKFTIFNNTNDYKEELNVISNNKNKIVFLQKGKLIFIVISKKNDSISLLKSQLEYLYIQLMSILTIKFYGKLEDNPSKCLTAMTGTENLFEQIIKYSSNSFISLFNSYHVMSYISHRKKINKIIEEYRGDALYCILMTPYEIISLSHSKNINVVPSDLVLIQTLIYSTEMLRTQVSYVPICLPGISDEGYIQFYSRFTDENIGVIFVTEKMESQCFNIFQNQFNRLYDKLNEGDLIERILNSMLYNNNIMKEKTLMKSKDQINKNKSNKSNLNPKLLKEKSIFKLQSAEINEKNPKQKTLNRTLTTLPNHKDLFRSKKEKGKSFHIKNEELILSEIIYGVALNKKLNQYFLINFDMDFRILNKEEKQLIKYYNILFDIYNSDESNKEKKNYYFVDRKDEYINVLLVDDKFLTICSYDYVVKIDEAINYSYDFHKYLNKKDYKYFIEYK